MILSTVQKFREKGIYKKEKDPVSNRGPIRVQEVRSRSPDEAAAQGTHSPCSRGQLRALRPQSQI